MANLSSERWTLLNSYTVSLPVLNTMLRFPGSQILTFVILTKSSQCLLTLLLCSAAFPMVFFNFSNCVYMHAHVAF